MATGWGCGSLTPAQRNLEHVFTWLEIMGESEHGRMSFLAIVSDNVAEPEGIYELVRILVSEVLHLYQYQERRQDQEARMLASLPVSSPGIRMDESNPGRLYVPSPDLLFTGSGARILVPPTCRDAAAAMINLKHRLARHGLLDTITIGLGE